MRCALPYFQPARPEYYTKRNLQKNKKCRIAEDINSGNVECKITSVIVYAATTVPKVEFSGRNSTEVFRRNVDIENVRSSLMCITRNLQ
jgi:hypothetical protein